MSLVLSGDSPSFSGTYQGGVITSGTAITTTSGTAHDFTGIPSWAKRITVMLNGVSTNGASIPQIQLGAGSILSSGYLGNVVSTGVSTVGTVLCTTGFYIDSSGLATAGAIRQGAVVFTLLGSNIWTCQGAVGHSDLAGAAFPSGSVTLSGTLDRIRLTTVNGTDTFDAGSVNILYE